MTPSFVIDGSVAPGRVVAKLSFFRKYFDIGLKILFIFSLCLISLVYGFFARHYQIFPYRQIRDSKAAVDALLQVFNDDSDDGAQAVKGPLVKNHSSIDDGALILVSGGPGYLESHNADGGCLAWLMDRAGKIKHVWKYDPHLWSDLEHTTTLWGKSEIVPFGVHLLEDGGLLVSFQGKNTWPFAVGLVRLDVDSNVIWKKECHAHHWLTIGSDGNIITPTLRVIDAPKAIGKTRGRINGSSGKILEDMIAVINLDGEIIEEFSILEAIHDSGLVGLYQGAYEYTPDVNSMDPLHLNYVKEVGTETAGKHDWLNADDLLLSFRSVNSIAILDRGTKRIKWIVTGQTLRQHSPIFQDADNILVFDNLGGNQSLGGSRLVRIDLTNRRAQSIFPTKDHQPAGIAEVLSEVAGHLDLSRDKKSVMMAVTKQSRVLEIDLQTQEVIWEYFHTGEIHTAKYCYDVTFVMNQE